jgi:predicted esterase
MMSGKTTGWSARLGVSAALSLLSACASEEPKQAADLAAADTASKPAVGRTTPAIPGGIPPVATSAAAGSAAPAPSAGLPGLPQSRPSSIPGGVPPAPPPGAAPAPAAPAPPAFAMAMGPEPTLPPIVGECPVFMNGTVMVAGHKSIVLQVGEPNKGGAVLFYWHGTGSSASEGAGYNGNAEVVASGGIVAAFNGSQSSGRGGDCSGTAAHNMADFEATDQIVACGKMMHGIDARRIYTTGCSAGGLQSGCLAQMRSSYIAAAAPNSGGVVAPQAWQTEHTPAIFTMHGGPSDQVIVVFSQTSATLDQSAKSHGSFVVNCDHQGGHCQAPADLQKAGWQFMKDHYWGISESPWAKGMPPGVPDYCKVF